MNNIKEAQVEIEIDCPECPKNRNWIWIVGALIIGFVLGLII